MPIDIDKIDKQILYELDRNARIPDTKLAKIVNRSKESVRYRIKQLQEKGVIKGFSIWIDPTKLGFRTAKMYLSLANIPQKRKEFGDYIIKDKRLFWFGSAEGAWNIGLTYFIHSTREFFELKNKIFSQFRDLILESHTGMLVNVNTGDKTFFHQAENQWQTIFDKEEQYVLDDLEKNILKDLFANARINIVTIARKHNTTVDKVRSRIKKLEKRKIIYRYTVIIDHYKLGHEFFKTFLYFKKLTKEDEARLMEYTRKVPEIIHVVKQISPWDIELEMMCDNYLQYTKILSDITKEFSNIIQKTETAIMGEDFIFPAEKMVFE